MSEYGTGRWKDIRDDDRQGTGAKGLAANGTLTTGNLLATDSTGSASDAGVPTSNIGVLPMGFLIAWEGGDATGTDIAGHRPISQACVPFSVTVRAKTAPVGADYSIDIRRVRGGADVSILAGDIVLAAGDALESGVLASGMSFEAGDYLVIDATQESGGTAPENVFIEIQVRLS